MNVTTHPPDPNIMKRSRTHLPWLLVYLKLLVAVLLLVLAFSECQPLYIILLCLVALAGDAAGKMFAKRLQLNRKALSQMITRVDTVFWFSCLFYLCINRHDFLKLHITALFILVSSELFIILFGLLVFRERLSHHTLPGVGIAALLGVCPTHIRKACRHQFPGRVLVRIDRATRDPADGLYPETEPDGRKPCGGGPPAPEKFTCKMISFFYKGLTLA